MIDLLEKGPQNWEKNPPKYTQVLEILGILSEVGISLSFEMNNFVSSEI